MDEPAPIPIHELFEGRLGDLREMRFWSKVKMGGPDECWPWQGSRARGYGRFKIVSNICVHANRVAWVLANKRDPGSLLIRHSCDNPPCCNPAHLLAGTHADNMADKVARNRCRTGNQGGINNPRAQLSMEQLRLVIEALKAGESNIAIANRFPVGHSLVSRIRVGRAWRSEAERLGWVAKPQFKRRAANHEGDDARKAVR